MQRNYLKKRMIKLIEELQKLMQEIDEYLTWAQQNQDKKN